MKVNLKCNKIIGGFMKSLNKVMLIGNLGKDPDLRYTPNGTAVLRFSIATTMSWKDQSGQFQEKTEWHNIIMWGKRGDSISQYLGKGMRVYIEGRLTTRKWQDQNGNDRYTTEINASDILLLTPKGNSQNTQAGVYEEPMGYDEDFGSNDIGDDIPF